MTLDNISHLNHSPHSHSGNADLEKENKEKNEADYLKGLDEAFKSAVLRAGRTYTGTNGKYDRITSIEREAARLVEMQLDSLYPSNFPLNASICLLDHVMQGSGDVVFGRKTADAFCNKLSSPPLIFTNKPESFSPSRNYQLKQYDKNDIPGIESVLKEHEVALIAPVTQYAEFLVPNMIKEELESPSKEKSWSLHLVSEYAYPKHPKLPFSFTSGPSEDHLGTFNSPREKIPFSVAIEGLITPGLKAAFTKLYTPDAKLVFIYGAEKETYFNSLNIIAPWIKKRTGKEQIVVCLLEGRFNTTRESMVLKEFQGWDGFGSVRAFHLHKFEKDYEIIGGERQLQESGPVLNVLSTSFVHPDDFDRLIRSSSIAVGTGDQSVSEIYSLIDIIWLYEVCDHKKELHDSFVLEAKKCGLHDVAIFLNLFFIGATEFAAKMLIEKEDELLRQFVKFNEHLTAKKNLADSLCSKVVRSVMKTRYPNLKIDQLERAIVKNVSQRLIRKEIPKDADNNEPEESVLPLFAELEDRIQQTLFRTLSNSLLQNLSLKQPQIDIVLSYIY